MFDVSSKFNRFYSSHVVLPQDEQNKLYQKKDLNIKRLKEGIAEYNAENMTSFQIVETFVQGSVAMSTVIQNEGNDYDIDVAIVFNKSDLGDKGPYATRNMVANALRRKTKQFSAEPEVKTSSVRIKYAEGYHVDFAMYRRYLSNDEWIYEHAGSEWEERDLRGIVEWFKAENYASGGDLRRVVRLSKMFCVSRDSWVNMPNGLLQTVLCNENLQNYTRLDELFYYTMKHIVERLESDTSVAAPVDSGRDLTPRKSDIKKMTNWKNRLKSKLEDLEVLFKEDCSEEDAIQAWYGFFNHNYWSSQITETSNYSLVSKSTSGVRSFSDTEQFIDDLFPVKLDYTVNVSCKVSGDGWRQKPISEFLSLLRRFLPHNFEIRCSVVSTTVPAPYDIYWKVKNTGPEAERRNQVRGQIANRGTSIVEHTNFYGNHYIECYRNMCCKKAD